ncbi:ribosome biogenesis GTPase Der [Candidatus Peribacteria bacterium RIFCSPHIGHO2_12_FULL_55_11]|nr:MAG: ribosome biogenesis GTPase Der [Candidatus Peribacteria bacterium RIFCSPHIGHO2_12_FULL_55_11]
MNLPTVAIVGRPNTGKSRLFNRIIGQRKAIVSDIPGTTRDQVASKVESDTVDYLLVDTGGMGGGTTDTDFEDDVEAQSRLAVEHADVIVFVLSGKDDITSADHAVAKVLRTRKRKHVPVIVAVNKLDNPGKTDEILPQYYELGIGDPLIPVSAAHGSGFGMLEDAITSELKKLHFSKPPKVVMDPEHGEEPVKTTVPALPRIAVVGKPNVGKSSIVNALMSDPQRASSPRIVSEIPGTTRDAVDTAIRYNDHDYIFVDTAGIKKKKEETPGLETLAYFRSIQAISNADIVVLVLDGTQAITRQDKRIAQMCIEEGKGLILAVNKSDGMELEQKKNTVNDVQLTLPFCRFAPIILCSAKSRDGLLKLFDLIETVQRNRVRRIPTKDLHNWYTETVRGQPMDELAKSKHITQADDVPPTFVVFVKDPKKVKVSELKFLERRLRSTFAFEGTTVRWITKGQKN